MKAKYILNTGEIAAGASKLMADLFNATGSGYKISVYGLYVRPKSDVAVTGAVSARFDIYRTSAVGTSGQTIGYASSSATAATIAPLDTQQNPIPTGISARTIPTGGATITVRLSTVFAFSEETSSSVIEQQYYNVLHPSEEIVVRPGEGLLIKQGSVASLNSYEFEIHFTLEEEE